MEVFRRRNLRWQCLAAGPIALPRVELLWIDSTVIVLFLDKEFLARPLHRCSTDCKLEKEQAKQPEPLSTSLRA
jgi:hypothetical protein